MTDIAHWIASGRKAEGLSRSQLADKIDAEVSDVKAWETGEDTPTVAHLGKLRDLIGTPEAVKADAKKAKSDKSSDDNGGRDIDFERKLFKAADKLRNVQGWASDELLEEVHQARGDCRLALCVLKGIARESDGGP